VRGREKVTLEIVERYFTPGTRRVRTLVLALHPPFLRKRIDLKPEALNLGTDGENIDGF
jgi:hypothetical protein